MMNKKNTANIVAISFALSGLLAFGGSYSFSNYSLQKDVTQKSNKITILSKELGDSEKEIEKQDKDIKDLQSKIEERDRKLSETSSELDKMKSQIDDLQKQVKSYSDRNESPSISLNDNGRTIDIEQTAYTNHADENGGTYSGKVLTKTGYDITDTTHYNGYQIVATDPSVIPLYSIIKITYKDGNSIMAISIDTGGAIKGDKIDFLVRSGKEADTLGKQMVSVKVLREGKGI